MTDLRDVLQHRTSGLAHSLRNADEFNATTAKGIIKRKRAMRATLIAGVAAVTVIAVGAGAWAGYGAMKVTPAVSATPSSTPSTSPSASPSVSASAAPLVYKGRNPNMTDEEALARAENPATGEVWLANPEAADPGAWADDSFWEGFYGPPVWKRVGSRDDNDILVESNNGYLVEVGADGEPRFIAAPRPDQAGVSTLDDSPIAVDTNVYYDSLALPKAFTTPEGAVVHPRDTWGPAVALADLVKDSIDEFGANELLRTSRPSLADYWGEGPAAFLDGNVSDIDYLLATPYGVQLYAPFNPAAEPIQWNEDRTGAADPLFIDFFDQGCGAMPGSAVAMKPDVGGPWHVVGNLPHGDVLAPDASSKLARAMYANYKDLVPQLGGDGSTPILSYEDYLNAPAFVAVTSANPDLWWIVMNKDLSARYWC